MKLVLEAHDDALRSGKEPILDVDFIARHTHGFEAFADDLRRTNWEDILSARGIAGGDTVEIESLADGNRRIVGGFWAKAHNIAAGSIGAYYPETNPLLPLAYHDLESGTPVAKSIPVVVRLQAPQPNPGA